jgi:conjugal transfer pilin signal peptidase TrbI
MIRSPEFKNKRKRLLLYGAGILILFFFLFNFISSFFSIAFTVKGQECFPYKVWLIRKGVIPEKGEYVAFKNHRVDGRRTWIKVLTGREGDRIEVLKFSPKERYGFFVDEIGKELKVQGIAVLHTPLDGDEIFMVFERDTKGRELPIIDEGKIPEKKYFVSSPAIRSYDSRYWGLIDESDIVGKAYPLI